MYSLLISDMEAKGKPVHERKVFLIKYAGRTGDPYVKTSNSDLYLTAHTNTKSKQSMTYVLNLKLQHF